ncbi:hypothetical protein ACFV4K_10455 [Nocardia sp. NPDC059764]|uniref:hypothetical protein n=1 Tax=Nocardia sp. NPDC059764 TaxID=3346939 RepID=UPI00365A2CF8
MCGAVARLSEAGLFTEEQIATTCCFATQDKVWVTGPNAEKWEVYTVLADTENFGTAPEFATRDAEAVQACCGTGSAAGVEDTAGDSPACCTGEAKQKAVATGADCCS